MEHNIEHINILQRYYKGFHQLASNFKLQFTPLQVFNFYSTLPHFIETDKIK